MMPSDCPKAPERILFTDPLLAVVTHCWHDYIPPKMGNLPSARKCCFCGKVQVKKLIPDPNHGPHHPSPLPITTWADE